MIRVYIKYSAEFPNNGFSLPSQGITFYKQEKGFERNSQIHSGEDVSSTSKDRKITQKPRIYLKAKIFASLLCSVSLFTIFLYSLPSSLFSLHFKLKKGFLTSKVCLAPFSRLAWVSECSLSELGALSAGRDKCLVERADDALSAQMLLIFYQLAKRAECLA